MCQSKTGRFLADLFHRGSPMSLETMRNRLQQIIDKELTDQENPQLDKAKKLLKQFTDDSDHKRIEHLIRLYTLETKFYRELKQDPIPLALPLYRTLDKVKDRYFQGITYRGAHMDNQEINTYQWAVHDQGTLLQTRHFTSTSLQRSVAEEFLFPGKKKSTQRNTVLFTFTFPNKCEQAINLCRISDEQGCLSEFENEAEVLVLPWTLFQVDKVEKESGLFNIYLTNIILPHKGILSSFKWILKHPIGSIKRFNEHFPRK
jgi:hypothetical protein